MIEPHPVLAGWDNFYVIVGSSGAALIGLQFVVIALINDTRMNRSSGSITAFGTPTVVHFGGALLISAIMSAPWPTITGIRTTLAIIGLIGLAFGANVLYHTRKQSGYTPVLEDWVWHVILPFVIYAALTVGALRIDTDRVVAAFVVAGAALALLLVGIHNAWDTVTYIVISAPETSKDG